MNPIVETVDILSKIINTSALSRYLLILFFALVLTWKLLWMLPGVDESLFVWVGWQVSKGKILYKDVFEFITPGTSYLIATVISFLRFGTNEDLPISIWPVLRSLSLILWVYTLWILETMLKVFTQEKQYIWILRVSLLSFLILNHQTLLLINHHTYSSFFALTATWTTFHLKKVETPKNNNFIYLIAGLLCGLSSCFTQTLGVFMVIALSAIQYLISRSFKSILLTLIGFMVPFLVTLFFFWQSNALLNLFNSIIGFSISSGYKEFDSIFSSFPLQSNWKTVFYFLSSKADNPHPFVIGSIATSTLLLTIIIMVSTPLSLITIFSPRILKLNDSTKIIGLSTLAFITASLASPTSIVLSYHSGVPLLLVLIYLSYETSPKIDIVKCFFRFLLIFISASNIILIIFYGYYVFTKQPNPLFFQQIASSSRLYDYSFDESNQELPENNVYQWIISHTKRKPITLFAFNYCPLFYLTLLAKNPTNYRVLIPVHDPIPQQQDILSQLKIAPPEWIIWDQVSTTMSQIYSPRIPASRFHVIPEFTTWVKKHYKKEVSFEPYIIYRHM